MFEIEFANDSSQSQKVEPIIKKEEMEIEIKPEIILYRPVKVVLGDIESVEVKQEEDAKIKYVEVKQEQDTKIEYVEVKREKDATEYVEVTQEADAKIEYVKVKQEENATIEYVAVKHEKHKKIEYVEVKIEYEKCAKENKQKQDVTIENECDETYDDLDDESYEDVDEEQDETGSENSDYSGSRSKRRFITKTFLPQHSMIHRENKFLCSVCGRGFVSKDLLDSHSKVPTIKLINTY